ncbi:MAG: tetratricopeptide repeat protein [Deltaproteobacteria bacterium]|nr:tetratricopeptide repeat protein [Deltaproteobacteria bacterium]
MHSSRFTPLLRRLIAAAASASIAHAAVASADETGRSLGLSLARDGRCDAALAVLVPLRGGPGGDAELERLTGECALREKRFDLAIEALEAALKLEPGADGLDLRLAEAYYHAGRLADAEAALERAAPGDAARPEHLLYSGLVAFDRGDTARAVDRLEAAVATRDPGIEPLASFQLARAKARADDGEGARAGFGRVVEGWSGTAWADQAARALTALDEESAVPVWASAELGFEADDNALIRGRGVGRPDEVSGQSDVRGYWFVDTGALWLRHAPWSAGTALRYGGSENRRIERFNTHAPGATLWLDRALAWQGSALRLQYDVDAAWIGADTRGDDPFLVSHLWSTSLFKPWQSIGATTSLSASLGLDDYGYRRRGLDVPDVGLPGACSPCSPDGIDEIGATNRDGFGPILSVVHRQSLPQPPISGFLLPWIEGGYRWQLYVSQGREYDHQRHQIELGAGIRLPLAIDFSIRGRYAYVPYANASVFPDPKDELAAVNAGPDTAYFLDGSARREHETNVRIALQRAFGRHVLVSARWSRTRNRSTADVFDYTRDLVGVSVRLGWGG